MEGPFNSLVARGVNQGSLAWDGLLLSLENKDAGREGVHNTKAPAPPWHWAGVYPILHLSSQQHSQDIAASRSREVKRLSHGQKDRRTAQTR